MKISYEIEITVDEIKSLIDILSKLIEGDSLNKLFEDVIESSGGGLDKR